MACSNVKHVEGDADYPVCLLFSKEMNAYDA